MKKKTTADVHDDLRPEYPADFFRAMKPNRFAGLPKEGLIVVLDADVSRAFRSSRAVNTALRSMMKRKTSAVASKQSPAPSRATAKGSSSKAVRLARAGKKR